jgi:hypothetical protein
LEIQPVSASEQFNFASAINFLFPGDNTSCFWMIEENHVEYACEDENTSFSAYNLRFRFVICALSKISWKHGKDITVYLSVILGIDFCDKSMVILFVSL